MENNTKTENAVTLNASGKSLGRLASEVASILRGKTKADFERYRAPKTKVIIENAAKLSISQKKEKGKLYTHYTGYPSGLRKTPMGRVIEKKGPREVLRRAIYGMLPNNKLRSVMMKNITIHD